MTDQKSHIIESIQKARRILNLLTILFLIIGFIGLALNIFSPNSQLTQQPNRSDTTTTSVDSNTQISKKDSTEFERLYPDYITYGQEEGKSELQPDTNYIDHVKDALFHFPMNFDTAAPFIKEDGGLRVIKSGKLVNDLKTVPFRIEQGKLLLDLTIKNFEGDIMMIIRYNRIKVNPKFITSDDDLLFSIGIDDNNFEVIDPEGLVAFSLEIVKKNHVKMQGYNIINDNELGIITPDERRVYKRSEMTYELFKATMEGMGIKWWMKGHRKRMKQA